jgi:hypothetical protein
MPEGRVDITILPALLADRFAGMSMALIASANRHAQMIEQQTGGVSLDDQQKMIQRSFAALLEVFDQLERGGQHVNAR